MEFKTYILYEELAAALLVRKLLSLAFSKFMRKELNAFWRTNTYLIGL